MKLRLQAVVRLVLFLAPVACQAAAAPSATPPPLAPSLGPPTHREESSDPQGEAPPIEETEAVDSPDSGVASTSDEAYERAKPVFAKHCERCHSEGQPGATKAALSHFETTRHPFGGHHAHELGKLVPRVLGVGGKATMPRDRPGVVQGEELESLLAWARAFDEAQSSGPTPTHAHP